MKPRNDSSGRLAFALGIALASTLGPVGTVAQGTAQGTAHQAQIVLHDVRVIDGNGGTPLEHADIVITDGHIVRIEAGPNRTTDPSATVLDLKGRTAMPGLISDHSHLGLTNGFTSSGHNITRDNVLRQLRQYEAYGVTTVTALGLNTDVFYELQPQLHAGTLPGADLYGADRGFGVTGGAPPATMGILDSQVYRPATVQAAREEVRETARRHPSLVKVWVDNLHGTVPKMDPAIYAAIIDAAHAESLRVAAHVFYLDDAQQLVRDGVDVLAHGVRDRPVDPRFVAALKAHHVWYIPTLGLDESFYLFAEQPDLARQAVLRHALQPAVAARIDDSAWRAKVLSDVYKLEADRHAVMTNMQNVKRLYDEGVRLGFGTDSGATPLRVAGFAEHRELLLLTRAGLTPLQAIGTATKNAAALLDLEDRGTLQAGKLADILIVDGDPASDIGAVDRIVEVWHRGRQVAGPLASFSPK